MFEANFPTDREGVSYRTVWNLFKRIAAKKVQKHCPVIRLLKTIVCQDRLWINETKENWNKKVSGFLNCVQGLSDADKALLFSGTARKVYRLPTPDSSAGKL